MKKFYIQLSLLMAFALFNLQSFATEVYKYKTAGQGPNMFKQYSMCRKNGNDGFLYAGTTKNANNEDYMHIMACDDNFNTVWSSKYTPQLGYTLNCTKIIHNYARSGYWVSGYVGNGPNDSNAHNAFIMEIDNAGNILQQKIGDFQTAVFLDVEPTSDGGCIAVGFESRTISEIERVSGRRGLIVKFSSTLGVNWSREFTSAYAQVNLSNSFFECAENVTVVNTTNTGYLDYYFISGSVSSNNGSCNYNTSPTLYMAYLDNTGNTLFMQTTLNYAVAFDAALDSANYSMYVVGKRDICPSTQEANITTVNLFTGVYSQVLFEGFFSGFPYPHFLVPYKIHAADDSLFIFGYVRAYNDTGSSSTTNIMIPFTLSILKSDYNAHDLEINHSNRFKTMNYPSEDPGFLNNWDNNSSPVISDHFPSVYGPEPAIVYNKSNTRQWAMIGYFSINNPPDPYVLHLFKAESPRCNPFNNLIAWAPYTDPSVDLVIETYNFTTHPGNISQSSLNITENNCLK